MNNHLVRIKTSQTWRKIETEKFEYLLYLVAAGQNADYQKKILQLRTLIVHKATESNRPGDFSCWCLSSSSKFFWTIIFVMNFLCDLLQVLHVCAVQ